MAFQYPGTYLTFEVVSLVPYDRNLIDVRLLSPEQVSALQHCQPFKPRTSSCLLRPGPLSPLFPLPQDPMPLPFHWEGSHWWHL